MCPGRAGEVSDGRLPFAPIDGDAGRAFSNGGGVRAIFRVAPPSGALRLDIVSTGPIGPTAADGARAETGVRGPPRGEGGGRLGLFLVDG